MHPLKSIPSITVAFAALAAAAFAAEPADLSKLRESWQRAVQQATAPLDKKYVDALSLLKVRYTKEGKLEDALAVDAELKEIASRSSSAREPGEKVRHKWQMGSRTDFENAKKQAEAANGTLPRLKTEDDQKSFMKFFSKASPKGAAYLDAHFDEASQKWMWGDGTPITYFNWADKQPVMVKGGGIEIFGADGTWRVTSLGRALETVMDVAK